MFDRRALLAASPALFLPAVALAAPTDWGEKLVAAARGQIGRTVVYDPTYVRLAYPGGDVPIERGVCSDVVIRAYRTAFGLDLQEKVHRDMAANFGAYPHTWGLRGPDSNIDHRRVPNLEVFLRRKGAQLPPGTPWKAGDLITQRLLPGRYSHILIATGRRNLLGQEIIVQNNGAGARLETPQAAAELFGHYRLDPRKA
ncbi:DUF1287 domain-containing protein [Caulobacter sp. NIBR1757]|uniref:DUF1287 domain-containing protein n=1 Tax=Caulobacter sp. NIBR1757 TaxID=3016000 RepID=UPI0022F06F12|nr:DUF1287 domain-containing protein [Caulobacter sp. NIBR1757]WGM37202.1 hypothetical protein AMEJIAPC_00096 [Caulobacter sp. NIBR1757]